MDVKRQKAYIGREIFLLLILLFLRTHNTLQLPVFVDESLHILRGRVVWGFSDLGESLLPKKLLYYYWIGLFGLDGPAAAWLARIASALVGMIGGALCYGLAQLLFDRGAGLLALALYTFTPMLVFFERLALADSLAATFGTAILISSSRLARHPTPKLGAVTGALIGLAALAKLTALPFAVVPLVAARLYGGRSKQRGRIAIRPYVWMVGACLLVLAPSLAYVTVQELTGTADRVVVEQELYTTDNRPAQIAENLERTGEAVWYLITPGLATLVVIGAAILVRRGQGRTVLYLGTGVILAWGAILLVSAELTSRYLVLGVPGLLVLAAGGYLTPNPSPIKLERGKSGVVVAVWVVVFAGPFAWRAVNDPAGLRLPTRDTYEYVTSSASGYGLRELAADLPHLAPNAEGRVVVIGLLPSCHSLPLYWAEPNGVDLRCPLFGWDIRQKQALADQIVEWVRAEPVIYLALDEIGNLVDFEQLPITLDLLAVYPRPRDGDSIRLYRARRTVNGSK